MEKPKIYGIEVTDKGKYAIAYMLASYLAVGMEHDDLLTYYIDGQAKEFMDNPDKLQQAVETHGSDLMDYVTKFSEKLR